MSPARAKRAIQWVMGVSVALLLGLAAVAATIH